MGTNYLKIGAQELERRILDANQAYWDSQVTGYSDAEYEAMCLRLRTLLPESPALVQVGHEPRQGSRTVDHSRFMLSLRKASNLKSLTQWAKKTRNEGYYVTPKVDGVACRIVYGPDGELQFAATRGNGMVGELITRAIRASGCVDLRGPENVELRGELYINRSDFDRFADQGFSCARNLVAGYVKQKQPDGNFPLRFYPYDALTRDLPFGSEATKFGLFDTTGMEVYVEQIDHWEQFESLLERMETEVRPSWPFETDGLVFRVPTQEEFEELGQTGHHPRGAIAYKFSDETAVTVVRELTGDVSRTGVITPVLLFDPVNLAGASIGRATLHHYGRLLQMRPREGSTIRVSRRGAVIPHVEGIVSHGSGNKLDPLETCPSCGGVAWSTPGAPNVVVLTCHVPEECPGVMQARIAHYAATVGIKGFGPRMIEDLMLEGLLESLADIYLLPRELARDDTSKTRRNLIREIEQHSVLDPATFFTALGVNLLGKETAAVVCSKILPSKLLNDPRSEELEALPGIGHIAATAIEVQLKLRKKEHLALARHVHLRKPKKLSKGGKFPNTLFAGASVLFTGPLPTMSRDIAENHVRRLGGTIARSAGKTLDILVSTTPESGKTRQAKEWIAKGQPICIMSDTEFAEAIKPQ